MIVTITSFSYKHGLPEEKMAIGNIGTGNTSTLATLTTFDCRAMPNPYWDESLRGYTGRGNCCQCVNVTSCQFQFPMEDTWSYRILAIGNIGTGNISTLAKLNTGRDHLQVAFGCTGGQHRSVYFAERMAERLAGIDDVKVEVSHTAKLFWKMKEGMT